MSDNPNDPVLAYHTVTREKREVPAFWLDNEASPFPGQWVSAPSTLGDTGTESDKLPDDAEVPEPQLPDFNIAGDSVTPSAPAQEPAPESPSSTEESGPKTRTGRGK